MAGRYKAYPEYKESGIEWLGKVPQGWSIHSLKRSVDGVTNGIWGNEPDNESDLIVLRVADFNRDQLNISDDKLTFRSIDPKDRASRLLKKGDLLIEKSGGGDKTLVGCVVLFDKDYPAVTSNFVAKMTPQEGFDSSFLRYAFSQLYAGKVNFPSIKQTTGIQNLDSDAYLLESFVFPSFTEQQKIANFLDHETAKIDTLIAKQEKLIELLKEKRQAVISHAVTKGLNPNAPMRDSGVEWLGEVPEHWDVINLKYYASIQGGYAFNSNDFVDNGIQILRIGNVYQSRLALDRQPTFVSDTLFEQLSEFRVMRNDILMSLTGTLGKRDYGFAVKVDVDGNFLMNQRVAKLTPLKQKITRSYLLNILWSEPYLNQLYALPSGTKQANLSNSDVLGIAVAIPTSKEEQTQIAEYIKEKILKLDALTSKAEDTILLMKERKIALISAAVTGKIDVRDWESQGI